MGKGFEIKTIINSPEIKVENEVCRCPRHNKIKVKKYIEGDWIVKVFEKYPFYIITEKLTEIEIEGKGKIEDFSELPFTIVDLYEKRIVGKEFNEDIIFSSQEWDEKFKQIIQKFELKGVKYSKDDELYDGQYYSVKGFNNKVLVFSDIICKNAHLDIEKIKDFEEYKKKREEVIQYIEDVGFSTEYSRYTFSQHFIKNIDIQINYQKGRIVFGKDFYDIPFPTKWFDDSNIELWEDYKKAKDKDKWEILIKTSATKHMKEEIEKYKKELKELKHLKKKIGKVGEELYYFDMYAPLGYGSGVEIEGERIDNDTIRIRWASIIYGDCGGSVTYSGKREQESSSEVKFKEEDWIKIKASYPVKVSEPISAYLKNYPFYYKDNTCMVVDARAYYHYLHKKTIKEIVSRIRKLKEALRKYKIA